MGLFTKMLVFILVSVMLLVGVAATFSLGTGRVDPLDFLSRIEITFNVYIAMGLLLLVIIAGFGLFIFFKEKFLGYS